MIELRSQAREWVIVAGVYLALVLITAVWLAIDRRPPEWDHANHLERVVHCAEDMARHDVRAMLPATEKPFALAADHVTVGGIPVPAMLVDWVVRTWDPSPRIASRLPVPVSLGRIDITPEAIRISARR
jgi:hypothetical protein